MSDQDKKYKVIEQEKGSLKYELVSPTGVVVATFKTRVQADSSAKVCNQGIDK